MDKRVTYYVELEGSIHAIEDVPARVSVETGESHFSPETVERLQRILYELRRDKERMDAL
ncbi:MAG: hypothetical protein OXH96_06855 [Spirochaetaceae bacterium]|nr:hypothetical protein [Spirochaetaceae bacterium]